MLSWIGGWLLAFHPLTAMIAYNKPGTVPEP